jgi:hypothetical protein
MAEQVGNWYHYSGAVHIHTTASDGTLPLAEVIAIGRKVGLDFMLFTDHMGLANREAGGEGIHGNTLVLIGYEHNDPEDNNHYLVFQSPGVYPENLSTREYVSAARRDGAIGIVAHPIEKRPRTGKYPPYPWLEWVVDDFDGLELWNQMSEWMEKLTPYNQLLMAVSPRKAMTSPPPDALRLWDELNLRRRYVGLAGVDAHGFRVRIGPFTKRIFPYKTHFHCLRTHVILAEPMSSDLETARQQFYDALRGCRVFISNKRWGVADRFQFLASSGGKTAVAGEDISYTDDTLISVHLPAVATLRLIHNGQTLIETHSDQLEHKVVSAGLYRVEAWKGNRGWIFSNHIRIGLGK